MTVDRDINSHADRRDLALAIWEASQPARGTLVQSYLESRDIVLPPPPTLRFHPGLKRPAGSVWPAMVALVTRGQDETPIAIHRTFIAPSGAGKADVEPNKMTLGAPAGAAVRLGRGRGPLIICEGIETCLSCMQLWGLPGWSALCANGVASLAIEGLLDEIVIAADNDPAGRRAAGDLHQRVNATGRRASVLIPEARLKDFNDVLRSTVSARRTR